MLATMIPLGQLTYSSRTYDAGRDFSLSGYLAMTSVMAVAVWLNFAVGVRRLHDRGMSGWWLLAIYGAAFGLFALVGSRVIGEPFRDVAIVLFLIVEIAGVVLLGVLPGTRGANRFGGENLPAEVAATFD